jgi:hypothetical protein
MSATDMPILYQNIMYALPSEFARDVFLWATERAQNDTMLYAAEAFSREVDDLVKTLTHLLDVGAKQHGQEKHDPDLMRFTLTRHANWRFGGNVIPEYAGAS